MTEDALVVHQRKIIRWIVLVSAVFIVLAVIVGGMQSRILDLEQRLRDCNCAEAAK